VNLPNRVPPEFGELGSMGFEGWFHERTLDDRIFLRP